MKFTIVFLICTLLQVRAGSFAQEITLRVENQAASDVFSRLRDQTKYDFLCNAEVISSIRPITLNVSKMPLKDVLERCLSGQPFVYTINDDIKTVTIKRSTETRAIFAARQQLITGKVTDETNLPLADVSIKIKNSSVGTVTNNDGQFSLAVPDRNTVLVFSYVGYQLMEVAVGTQKVINVTLRQASNALTDVVVTAFGIKRQEKALSYSVQRVDGAAISRSGTPNVLNGLQGKVAGVTIRQSSGAPGNTPAVNIRGSRSLTGSNEPLYVVDGLPISGRAMDINPSDVESVNVLKGPTAAALYGLRASNGVVIITTKRGESGTAGKPVISLESGLNFDQVTRYPDQQKAYAQGTAGKFGAFDANSWGPRIDTMGTYTNQLGKPEQAAIYDNAHDFFQTGATTNLNLQIAKRLEKGNVMLGTGYSGQTGAIPNSGYKRYSVNLATDYDLTTKLKVSTSINFSSSNTDLIVDGGGNSGVINAAYFAPVTYDLKNKPLAQPDDPYNEINFRSSHDNIYWSVANNSNRQSALRTLGNVFLQYKPIDWLSVTYRIGADYRQQTAKQVYALGSGNTGGRTTVPSGGSIQDAANTGQQVNSNFNATFDKKFGDLNVNFLAGNEVFDTRSKSLTVTGTDITIGGFDNIANTSTQRTTQAINRQRIVGFYGNLSLAWKNMLYLNATGRNDLASNMPRGNRSFFYPSLGLSFAFTELLKLPKTSVLDFGKIRASVAEVGQVGPIFVTNRVFQPGAAESGQQAGAFAFPFDGINAYTTSSALISANLQPENTKTTEFGIDLRFFKRRLNIEYTYYESESKGQIFRVPVPTSTGYASELRNAGQMSVKGHEVVLSAIPLQTKNFSWNLTTNFTAYKNKVISLAEGIDRLELGGSRATIVAEAGQSYPSLRGFGYARDPASGDIVVDSRATLANGRPNLSYGMPLQSTAQINLGSVVPDFEFGVINQFTYKGWSVSAQIDWRKGGVISSGSNRLGKLYGVLQETADRTVPTVITGKKGFFGTDGKLNVVGENDITMVKGEQYYRINQDPIIESNVYDGSFVRLREVRVNYDLPAAWVKKAHLGATSLYLTGRNLWLKARLPYFDPELNNGTGNAQGEEYMAYPQVISFGGGLRITL